MPILFKSNPTMATTFDHGRPAPSMGPTPIWLDCDTGHDDAIAILLAARNPSVRLLGISTVFGNASLSRTTYNTRAVLKTLSRSDVPVYAGASKPMYGQPVHAPEIHGTSGLDGTSSLLTPDVPAKSDMSAVDAMCHRLMSEPPGTPWLVATGALTNIASLFVQYPTLAGHIAGLSIMGGAVGNKFTDAPMGKVHGQGLRFGNHTPYAEFNIYCDPDAAQALFSNQTLATKTTLIPLDLTHQFLATKDVQTGLLLGFGSKLAAEPTMEQVSRVRRLYYELINFFAKTYADVFGLTDGPPTHDPLAVAAAFRPDAFYSNLEGEAGEDQSERFKVEVVTEGEHDEAMEGTSQRGRTVVDVLGPGAEGIRIPRGLDARQIWSMIEACLGRAELAAQKAAADVEATASGPLHVRTSANYDMTSLVPNAHTTLSQFELYSGVFPDIKGPIEDEGGEFLTTNKVGKLGQSAMDLSLPGVGFGPPRTSEPLVKPGEMVRTPSDEGSP